MRSVEASGKTLEDAKEQALSELGAPETDAVIEILEETKGFLGLGHSVRVRATLKEKATEEEAKAEPPAEAAEEGPKAPESEELEDAETAGEEPTEGEPRLAPLADEACAVAQRIIDLMGVSVEARVASIASNEVQIDLDGSDVGLLIGKQGDTLDAYQLLVAVIANRKVSHGGRVLVDAQDYRARRTKMLEEMARTQAAKVKESEQEVVIPDLKAYERRVVHMALQDDPLVETYSEGEGRHRHLVITPVD